ncbi:MAG: hypothetical protein AAF921_02565 [Cyanobacteria bacterium P01_D01_bin.44]
MSDPTHSSTSPRLSIQHLLTSGLILTLAGFLFDIQAVKHILSKSPIHPPSVANSCESFPQPDIELSREQLAQLLTIPERDPKARIRQIVDKPFCRYLTLNVRSGVEAEREAYPLAFAPTTTLVILYEDDEYAGYRFSIR